MLSVVAARMKGAQSCRSCWLRMVSACMVWAKMPWEAYDGLRSRKAYWRASFFAGPRPSPAYATAARAGVMAAAVQRGTVLSLSAGALLSFLAIGRIRSARRWARTLRSSGPSEWRCFPRRPA